MALTVFDQYLDPADYTEFEIVFDILEAGEEIQLGFELELEAEAALYGLQIDTTSKVPVRTQSNTAIQFWLSVAEENQEDVAFSNQGKIFEIRAKVTTNQDRVYERTVGVKVVQL